MNGVNQQNVCMNSMNEGCQSGADLSDAALTQARGLDEACGDVYTKLPEGFTVKPCPEKR